MKLFIPDLRQYQTFLIWVFVLGQKVNIFFITLSSKTPCQNYSGDYKVESYAPDLEKIPKNIMESGDYMMECKLCDQSGELVKGIQVFGQVINIPPGQGTSTG
jgi:hypothetical protein